MRPRSFEAIIFDHDGTLIDTETPDLKACQTLFAEHGLSLSVETWAEKIVGRMDGYHDLFGEVIRVSRNGVTAASLWQRLRELWQINLENVELMPGVANLLPQLRAQGYPLAVATASDRNWTSRWLTHFNLLPYFQVIATSDDVINNKPAPDVYLFAAQQLGVAPQRCLVFEDSLVGAEAAQSAGMTVVAVPSHVTRTLNFGRADAVVHGLENVSLAWVEAFGKTLNR